MAGKAHKRPELWDMWRTVISIEGLGHGNNACCQDEAY